jgi:hypothetical protein
MNWLISGGEITLGVALFVGLVLLVSILRPRGTMEPKRIVSFPGAWILVGLPITFGFGLAVALIAIGVTTLN